METQDERLVLKDLSQTMPTPTHLADSPNILVPRFLVKSQIFVQTKPNIVAVKAVSELVQMQKVLLESAGDGGLE